jgi:hypothetical protein
MTYNTPELTVVGAASTFVLGPLITKIEPRVNYLCDSTNEYQQTEEDECDW